MSTKIECYLIETVGDIDPVLHGPYTTSSGRNKAALHLRGKDPQGENGIFALDVIDGKLSVYAYSGGFMETALKPVTKASILKKYAKSHGIKVIDLKMNKNLNPGDLLGLPSLNTPIDTHKLPKAYRIMLAKPPRTSTRIKNILKRMNNLD